MHAVGVFVNGARCNPRTRAKKQQSDPGQEENPALICDLRKQILPSFVLDQTRANRRELESVPQKDLLHLAVISVDGYIGSDVYLAMFRWCCYKPDGSRQTSKQT